jgi:hypothetical protein
MSSQTAAQSITKYWLTAVRPRSDVIRCQGEPPSGDRHVHFGVAFHAAGNALVRLVLGLFEKVPAEKHPKEEDQENDHQRRTDELGQRELPAQQHQHDEAELEDEIGGRHLERHRGCEIRALAEDRAGERHGRVGA